MLYNHRRSYAAQVVDMIVMRVSVGKVQDIAWLKKRAVIKYDENTQGFEKGEAEAKFQEILEKVEHWLDPSLQRPGDLEHIWATLEEAWDLEFPHPAVGALENKHEALSAHLLGERGQGQVLTGRDDVVVNLDF